MHLCICDDTDADRRLLLDMLRDYCAERGLSVKIQQFSDARALMQAFMPGKYQILFLDIYMPGMSGMEAAQMIRERDSACQLVFATTSEEHALESYGVFAAGYLLKPYSKKQMQEAMDWCLESLSPLTQTIEIISERERVSLPLHDIAYIEVYGREAIFHTAGHAYSTNRSLTELESELPEDFLRCHRSYIVNMNQIASASQNEFRLKNQSAVPISTDGGAKAKQRFFDWMFERTWEGR